MRTRPTLAIESPYGSSDPRVVELNVAFVDALCLLATDLGYAPFAMHTFYTRFLNDRVARERHAGIECGLSWTRMADVTWFCLLEDQKITPGMAKALEYLEGRTAYLKRFRFEEGVLKEVSTAELDPETVDRLRHSLNVLHHEAAVPA